MAQQPRNPDTRLAAPKAPSEWAEFLAKLQETAFVVGPVADGLAVPDGFTLQPVYVRLEVGADSFKVGTDYVDRQKVEMHALTKSGIEKLGAAAGCVAKAVRVDDRGDPRACEYEATACMRQTDGSPHYASGSRSYDLNPEGSDYIEVYEKARSKKWKDFEYAAQDNKPVPPPDQWEKFAAEAGDVAVAQARATMQRNAETKAKLRAMRTCMGIRSKYRADELAAKPFVVLKLSFTGKSEDPVLRRQFGTMIAAQYLGASSALFGASLPGPAPQPTALPAPEPVPAAFALPHDDSEPDPPDGAPSATGKDGAQGNSDSGVPGSSAPAGVPSRDAAAPAAESKREPVAAASSAPPASPAPPSPGPIIPKGFPGQGSPLRDAKPEDIDAAMKKTMTMLGSGTLTPDQKAKAETFVNDCAKELDARQGQMSFGEGS